MLKINLTRIERATNMIRYYALNIAIIITLVALFGFLTFMNVYFLRG